MKISFLLIFLVISILNVACDKKIRESVVSEKYNAVANHCMGRSSIQLPTAFSASDVTIGYFKSVSSGVEIYPFDVKIDSRKLSKKDFSNQVLMRSTDFKNSASETVDVFRAEKKLSDVATLFRIQAVKDAYENELQFLLDGNLVVVRLDSYGSSYVAAEDRLIKFMSDFSIADQGKVRGFCVGPITIQGDFDEESGGWYWRDNAGNTFDIKIDTFATEDSRTLLQRMRGPDSLLSLFHIGHTVLRSGERAVAGMRAQEWLGWTNLGENGDEKTFKFVLETMRPKGSRMTPSITVTFDSAQKLENGTDTKTNLSDDEAMAIWDKVINSIQPAN